MGNYSAKHCKKVKGLIYFFEKQTREVRFFT